MAARIGAAGHDVVGFDPRGVQRSAPVSCLSDAELDIFVSIDGSPDTPAEEQALQREWNRLGAGCIDRRPAISAHVSTAEVVRDLDVLRTALGDRRLTYLGKSYGSFLGTTYAERFPNRVGRLVLDGQVDPAASGADIADGQVTGQVIGPDGPLGGVTITATDGQFSIETVTYTDGAVGAFTLRNLSAPGRYTVPAEAVCEIDLRIVRGAGSYVCGEESGLIASIEDARGMPKMVPFDRKSHGSSVRLRVTASQRVSRRPERSAAIANANGSVNDVSPRYSVGGWIVIQ